MLADLLQLARALEQKEELRRQRRGARVAIEALEERILLACSRTSSLPKLLRETPREAGLADADRAFDDDEAMRGGVDMRSVIV